MIYIIAIKRKKKKVGNLNFHCSINLLSYYLDKIEKYKLIYLVLIFLNAWL